MDEKLQRTALYEKHAAIGGRMVSFSGWDMPLQYASILNEARAVRSSAGIFDVSHMGRLNISGMGAGDLLNRILSVDATKLRIGKSKYNLICTENGGIIDDCIVYRKAYDNYLIIPNAANTSNVLQWIKTHINDDQIFIEDLTYKSSMIALQGPKSLTIVQQLTSTDLSKLGRFTAVRGRVAGVDTFLARTGYTGEDGLELIIPAYESNVVWDNMISKGAAPCGLGSRDVLRLEAGLLLHGNDMDVTTNPYEAGLGKFVDPDRLEYVARKSLKDIRDQGVQRKLVGFILVERGIPRQGYQISDGKKQIGEVTSGGYSPTLDRSIGMGYVPTVYANLNSRITIDIRGKHVKAQITALPFYTRNAII